MAFYGILRQYLEKIQTEFFVSCRVMYPGMCLGRQDWSQCWGIFSYLPQLERGVKLLSPWYDPKFIFIIESYSASLQKTIILPRFFTFTLKIITRWKKKFWKRKLRENLRFLYVIFQFLFKIFLTFFFLYFIQRCTKVYWDLLVLRSRF